MGIAILWWVAASVLVFFAWNQVISPQFKLAKLKWWHPFLVIATVAVLLAPCGLRMGGHGCAHGAKSGHCAKREHAGEASQGAAGGHCEKCKGGEHKAAGESCEHCKKHGAAKGDCAGDCKGKCDGKCAGKCSGGECAGGKCPHGH